MNAKQNAAHEIQKLIAKFTADITAAAEQEVRLRAAEILHLASAEANRSSRLFLPLRMPHWNGTVIDHINGNPFDNTPANLRFATLPENRR